jgi:hypothetical protein
MRQNQRFKRKEDEKVISRLAGEMAKYKVSLTVMRPSKAARIIFGEHVGIWIPYYVCAWAESRSAYYTGLYRSDFELYAYPNGSHVATQGGLVVGLDVDEYEAAQIMLRLSSCL